jgi:hypothetical protein
MEFYIKKYGDPKFDISQMEVDDEIAEILIQLETLLFTTKGSVLGDPDFGLNLDDYVYSFRYNDNMLVKLIREDINKFIPLSKKYNVDVTVDFTEEVDRHIVFISLVVDAKYQIGLYI